MRNRFPVVMVTPLVAVLLACSGVGPVSTPPVLGVEWLAVSVAGVQPPPRHAPTLLLTPDRISGSGGCNNYSGSARIVGGRLLIDQLGMTAMACLEDAANRVEQKFIEILGSRPLVGLREDQLVLSGPAGEIVFNHAPPPSPAA
jgi:heat shock protein HslJ